MHKILKDYIEWCQQNPDEDWQIDNINEFLANFSRAGKADFLDWVRYIHSEYEGLSNQRSINPEK